MKHIISFKNYNINESIENQEYDRIEKTLKKQFNIEGFTEKDGNKIVDKEGNPIIVYHNTNNSEPSVSRQYPSVGIFFTPNINAYNDYGKNKFAAIIKLKNPYYTSIPIHNQKEKIEKLKENGYDGIITNYLYEYESKWYENPEEYIKHQNDFDNVDGYDNRNEIDIKKSHEIIVFDKKNIKSFLIEL